MNPKSQTAVLYGSDNEKHLEREAQSFEAEPEARAVSKLPNNTPPHL